MDVLDGLGVARLADEGQAGGDQRFRQFLAASQTDAAVVQIAALAFFGPEHLVHDRIIGHGGDDFCGAIGVGTLQADCDRKMRHGVHEVGGAVDRVDDPHVGLVGAFDQTALFAEEAVTRTGLHQQFEEGILSLDVGCGNKIGRALARNLKLRNLAEVTEHRAGGLADGVHHDLQKCGSESH